MLPALLIMLLSGYWTIKIAICKIWTNQTALVWKRGNPNVVTDRAKSLKGYHVYFADDCL